MSSSKPKVLVIAHEDDQEKVGNILKDIITQNAKFDFDVVYDKCDPGKSMVGELDRKLENLNLQETCEVPTSEKKILFIVTKTSHNDNWVKFSCDVAAQMAWTVPLVVDEIPYECLDIRIRGQCIRLAEDGSIGKVIGALESTAHKDFCLPMAHIAPGMCSNYFFGFINVVFGTGKGPDFQKALDTWQENRGSQDTLVCRMILLIPKSCQCKRITDYPSDSFHSIEQHDEPFAKIELQLNELQPDRTYNQYMYNVQRGDAGSGGAGGGDAAPPPAYNVVVVMVSTVNTLYNMRLNQYAGITEDVMFKERERFSELLRERLEVYKDQVELMEFDDRNNKNVELMEFDDKNKENVELMDDDKNDKNNTCDLPKLIYERCREIVGN